VRGRLAFSLCLVEGIMTPSFERKKMQ